MKLHDLRPADGSRRASTRVGRGIAAGKGKTAGRGTKGQKARAGGSIPAWFEGGQTPLHMRIPKLRGFKNAFKRDYEVVNLGDIARLVELGRFEPGDMPKATTNSKASAPITVNAEILKGVGLVRSVKKPLKVLGGGDAKLSAALFVVADSFSRSAVSMIEAAGGSVSVLEIPKKPRPAIGMKPAKDEATDEAAEDADGETTAEAGRTTEEASSPRKAKPAREERPARGSGEAAPAEVTSGEDEPAPKARPARSRPAASADETADGTTEAETAEAAPADATDEAESPSADA